MSFLKGLFSSPALQVGSDSQVASQESLSGSSQQSLSPMAQQKASRHEMLRVVLRDTLNRAGIPTSWIGADLLAATSRGREPGIHVRLLMKHWDPRLMLHGVAFEQSFKKRLLTFDPQADHWLLGISWQFSLADENDGPPLPHPGVWTSSIPNSISHDTAEMKKTASDPTDVLGGSIVISGPPASELPPARPAATAAIRHGARNGATEFTTNARAGVKGELNGCSPRAAGLERHRDDDPSADGFAATQPPLMDEAPAQTRKTETEADKLQASFAKTNVFQHSDLTKKE